MNYIKAASGQTEAVRRITSIVYSSDQTVRERDMEAESLLSWNRKSSKHTTRFIWKALCLRSVCMKKEGIRPCGTRGSRLKTALCLYMKLCVKKAQRK